MAVRASKVTNKSFLSSEEVVVARGDLTSGLPVEAVNMIITGVNAGLHYAKMFGIPEAKDVDEMYKTYHDVDHLLTDEIKRLMEQADEVSRLLDYEADEE
jgi:hypothetical protein